jgi:hypothetical protein
MAADGGEARQHVHELIEQLGPDQIDAVLRSLEVMVEPEDEPLTEEDRRAVAAARDYFRNNPEGGVTLEQVAADYGFTMDQIRDSTD